MASEAECFDVSVEEVEGMVALAQAQGIGLVVVGPEVPLSLGLVDALAAVGIPAYGPNAAGAQLESSKAFCKDFFAKHNIPTAAYGNFTEIAPALAYLEEHPAPIVIKASGLAAGKGVIMAETQMKQSQQSKICSKAMPLAAAARRS
jgi:phosphoribosylamine--glycine ligase